MAPQRDSREALEQKSVLETQIRISALVFHTKSVGNAGEGLWISDLCVVDTFVRYGQKDAFFCREIVFLLFEPG